ncbi:hypothetical protein LPE509_02865 [Legionella pneumophila subsp. pneumophila LPE509]|nr:hypothetical protein LPE509_02865 [Legionella pneumophila subsp. pneumophila LPE509]
MNPQSEASFLAKNKILIKQDNIQNKHNDKDLYNKVNRY